jgi:ubiquinone/menaquinone biosynthesis C-methylase UbiE
MDTLRLPYRSDAFDVVLSIAVLHHLSTKERRLQALSELLRITKPGLFSSPHTHTHTHTHHRTRTGLTR